MLASLEAGIIEQLLQWQDAARRRTERMPFSAVV
jgi:hypothetical protein